MAITTQEKGTNRDKHGKSFVESPARGSDFSAQEVVVGNSQLDPIPVDPTTRGLPETDYNEVSSLGLGTLTIISKTIAPNTGVDLLNVECSGDNVAIYTVEINGTIKYKKRTYFTDFNTTIPLVEKNLLSGDTILVKVENKRNSSAQFNATLQFNEYSV